MPHLIDDFLEFINIEKCNCCEKKKKYFFADIDLLFIELIIQRSQININKINEHIKVFKGKHHSRKSRKRTCRKLLHAHMYVFDVIIEPVILSRSPIHLPWQKVWFEKFTKMQN